MDELRQDVGAHQPDESGVREMSAQRPDGVQGITRAEQKFGRADDNAPAVGNLARARDPGRQRLHAVIALQGVLRRDQPPYLVETEALQRLAAEVSMAVVSRVERTAQQADTPRRIARHARHRMICRRHGRRVPWPRTMFL